MIFLDTNILVYAYDKDEIIKHPKALDILEKCWEQRSGIISTQVLQEFYVTTTAKLPNKLAATEAREVIKDFLSWPIEQIVPEDIVNAIAFQERYKYSFWDSLIITIAQKSGADELYSEDLQDDQRFGDLIIVNPFK